MCRDLLRETRREQSKPGDGQTQAEVSSTNTLLPYLSRNFGYLYFTGVIIFQPTFYFYSLHFHAIICTFYSLHFHAIICTFYSLHFKNSLVTPI